MSENADHPATTAADIAMISAIPQRVIVTWAAQDGAEFADVFTKDGSMILPGSYVTGRDAIAEFMTAAFRGPYRGTQVTGIPQDLRFLTPDVAVLVSRGGVLAPGENKVAAAREVNATWVVVRDPEAGWKLAAYQNTPAVTA